MEKTGKPDAAGLSAGQEKTGGDMAGNLEGGKSIARKVVIPNEGNVSNVDEEVSASADTGIWADNHVNDNSQPGSTHGIDSEMDDSRLMPPPPPPPPVAVALSSKTCECMYVDDHPPELYSLLDNTFSTTIIVGDGKDHEVMPRRGMEEPGEKGIPSRAFPGPYKLALLNLEMEKTPEELQLFMRPPSEQSEEEAPGSTMNPPLSSLIPSMKRDPYLKCLIENLPINLESLPKRGPSSGPSDLRILFFNVDGLIDIPLPTFEEDTYQEMQVDENKEKSEMETEDDKKEEEKENDYNVVKPALVISRRRDPVQRKWNKSHACFPR